METSALYLYLLSPCDILSSFPIYLTSWHGFLDDRCRSQKRRREKASDVQWGVWFFLARCDEWLTMTSACHWPSPPLSRVTMTVILAVTASFVRGLETDSSYMSSKIWTGLLADSRWFFFPPNFEKSETVWMCSHHSGHCFICVNIAPSYHIKCEFNLIECPGR